MLFAFFKPEKRIIVCGMAVLFLLLTEVFSLNGNIDSFSGYSVKTGCTGSISAGRIVNSPIALLEENSLLNRLGETIRSGKRGESECEKSGFRFSVVLVLISLFQMLICLCYSRTGGHFEFIQQKYSIISFIHNKDGGKGKSLSCIWQLN